MVSDKIKLIARGIWQQAKEHNGRYLLAHRYRRPKPWEVPSGLDDKYDACQWLASQGYAEWLSAFSSKSPGIQIRPGGKEWT